MTKITAAQAAEGILNTWDAAATPDSKGYHAGVEFAMNNWRLIRANYRALLTEHKKLTAEVEDLRTDSYTGQRMHAHWQERAEKAEAERDEAQTEAREWHGRFDIVRTEREREREAVTRLTAERDEARAERDRLDEQTRNWMRAIDRLIRERDAVQAEVETLRALRDRWQETINAPGFEEAVSREAAAYHASECLYQRECDEARATLAALLDETKVYRDLPHYVLVYVKTRLRAILDASAVSDRDAQTEPLTEGQTALASFLFGEPTPESPREPTDDELAAAEGGIDRVWGWKHLLRYSGMSEAWMDQLRGGLARAALVAAAAVRREATNGDAS